MILAGMNITFRHYPFDFFLNSMEKLGLRHIELWGGEPHFYVDRQPLRSIRSIRKSIKERNLKVVCYTPEQCVYPFNLASSDPDLRRRSLAYFEENLYAAAELEAPMMLVTSGIGDYSVPAAESWKYACDSISRLARAAETEGIGLALEPLTRFETNLIYDLQVLKNMLKEIGSPALSGMIDTVAMQLEGETPDDYYAAFGEVTHCHLVDGDGCSDAHLSLGDGNLDWPSYLGAFLRHGYQGAFTLEIMGSPYYRDPEDAIRKSLARLRQFGFSS